MRKAATLFVIALLGFGVFTATVNLCRDNCHPCCRPAMAECHLKTMPVASADRAEIRLLDNGFVAIAIKEKPTNPSLLFADAFSPSALSDIKAVVNSSLTVKFIHPCEAPPPA